MVMKGFSMKIRNVFVTGASGKVGRKALPLLVKAGYRVRALQYQEPVQAVGVEIIQGNLADPELAPRALEDMDAVVHLANVKENRDTFMDMNVKGTFYLLDETRKCGHIQQFVQAGSDARAGIFYYPQSTPITENHPHRGYPGYYPLSKVLEEVLCEQFRHQYQLPITVLRFSWIHDEDDLLTHICLREPDFGVPIWKELATTAKQKAFFEDGRDGVGCLCHEDGTPGKRQIVGIGDVVQSIIHALGNPAAIGEAFSISAPAPFCYQALSEHIGKELDLPVINFNMVGFHDFSIDVNKVHSVMGLKMEWDAFRIADAAIAFRKSGKPRTPIKYIG